MPMIACSYNHVATCECVRDLSLECLDVIFCGLFYHVLMSFRLLTLSTFPSFFSLSIIPAHLPRSSSPRRSPARPWSPPHPPSPHHVANTPPKHGHPPSVDVATAASSDHLCSSSLNPQHGSHAGVSAHDTAGQSTASSGESFGVECILPVVHWFCS